MHGSSEPDLRNWHLQTQPGRIQPIDSSQLGGIRRAATYNGAV
ncbi:hypothetical protein L551_2074 [Bordetella pertussis STO1-SEAT-0004]|nr:hypothetical protein [Bordetella pertussis]ETI02553.1 hypothetical protein L551_2074 [Bordetella pertussis STO1-SEAT-0004]